MAKTQKTIADIGAEATAAFAAFVASVTDALENGEVAFTAPEKADAGEYSRADLEDMDIKTLRALAKDHGVESIKKAEIIDALAADDEDADDDEDFEEVDEDDEEVDEDDEADEDDSDEDDADDEEGYTREELEEMSLRDLRALARENEFTAAEIKGLDQDALIDALLGEEDEDADDDEDDDDLEDDDEADEDDDEGDDEGDDDETELTEDDLEGMTLAELKEVAGDIGITIPRNVKKPALIALIMDSADE